MRRISWLLVALVSACGSSEAGPLFESSTSTGSGVSATGAAGNGSTSSTTTNSATMASTGTNGGATGGGADPAGSGGGAPVGSGGTATAGVGGVGGAAGFGGAAATSGAGGTTGGKGANDASVKPDVGSGGSRPGDASVANDGGRETGPLGCDAGAFPTFESGCADTVNCSIGLHQINCCGTLVAIGLNHAFRDAFDKAEAAWRQACPSACGCMAGPTRADDGKSGDAQDVAVTCESRGPGSGRCVTSFP